MKRVICMYFSPTKTTQQVVERIGETLAKRFQVKKENFDFTLPEFRKEMLYFGEEDVLILGVPVYMGRVPELILDFLKKMNNKGALGLPVVVYGNRHYDDALIELGDLLMDSGCRLVGGGAFLGEHSYSRKIAAGRPNLEDLKEAAEFAEAVGDAIEQGRFLEEDLPGNRPYRPYRLNPEKPKPGGMEDAEPKVNPDLCTDCKQCAEVCPTGTIDYDDVMMKRGICIRCNACLKFCPTEAIYYDNEAYLITRDKMEKSFTDWKSNLTVIP